MVLTSTFADSRARLLGGLEAVAPARAGLGERIIKIDLILLSLCFHFASIILLLYFHYASIMLKFFFHCASINLFSNLRY